MRNAQFLILRTEAEKENIIKICFACEKTQLPLCEKKEQRNIKKQNSGTEKYRGR